MLGKINEECGVFAIYSEKNTDVNIQTYMGLYALQHRGQESCGIVVNEGGVFTHHIDTGLVPDVFTSDKVEGLGRGNIAIGHVRYSANKKAIRSNAQPLVIRHAKGPMAIAYNGSLVNADKLRFEYEHRGSIFHASNGAEVIAYAITEQRLVCDSIEKAVCGAMYKLEGAYSLVVMSPKKLIAARDPIGFRPLSLGRMADGAYVVSSETCAIDSVGAEFVRNLLPGEVITIDEEGVRSDKTHCSKAESRICVFEYVYFARPDSVVEGASVHRARLRAGKYLWREHPAPADVVIGVPDSGLDAALGLSRESGIPYGLGFVKNRYVGRTFIQSTQAQRADSVKIKLNVVNDTVKGKRVILVDDSIVRGTTVKRIVNLIREAGAIEVHVRISSPPFLNPCYFGTDIDSRDKLIACRMTLAEIKDEIGADSLGYISVDSTNKLAGNAECGFCDACFTGNYPMKVPDLVADKYSVKLGGKG
ncbi:MAG: amidophosphoribosyltransferase [Oscillospiraceae bacterium]|nr:amidophosphoribosyltransferase [Oscillospiraceae bacterium]